jgi:DNA-binding CsgD family transcriptional regulator
MSGTVKTLQQIADEYCVHRNTIRKWIKPIRHFLQIKNRRSLLPWQVELIYDFLDYPEATE